MSPSAARPPRALSRVWVGEIDRGAVGRQRGAAIGPGRPAQCGAELAGRAGDEDRARHAVPRRSAAVAATSGRHQSSLSIYQRTVFSMPLSNVSRGCQPSSSPIRVASIA